MSGNKMGSWRRDAENRLGDVGVFHYAQVGLLGPSLRLSTLMGAFVIDKSIGMGGMFAHRNKWHSIRLPIAVLDQGCPV
jgi:hypothetical protein